MEATAKEKLQILTSCYVTKTEIEKLTGLSETIVNRILKENTGRIYKIDSRHHCLDDVIKVFHLNGMIKRCRQAIKNEPSVTTLERF